MNRVSTALALAVLTASFGASADKWEAACAFPSAAEENARYPLQGFVDDAIQAEWWWTGQGSQVIPYEWFLHLTQAGSDKLFRDRRNFERFGYVYTDPNEKNPDSLPVGFAKSEDPYTGVDWFGPTCAACHTGVVRIDGEPRIIDGAPSLADFWSFNNEITEALEDTLRHDEKFDSFAQLVSHQSKDELRNRMQRVLLRRVEYNETNSHGIEYGHGRVDAFGVIFNQVVSTAMKMPENRREPDAPVSNPFMWGAHEANLVQWNGVGDNTLPYVGPVARNAGEVMGVYGNIEIDPVNKTVRTSALYDNLNRLENAMEKIRSPLWPYGKQDIDMDRCRKGAIVYRAHCERCHVYTPHDKQGELYRDPATDPFNRATMVPLWEIGTDPTMAINAFRSASTGFFEGDPVSGRFGPALRDREHTFDLVGHVVILSLQEYRWKLLLQLVRPSNIAAMGTHIVNRGMLIKSPELQYKARPLNGIWATGPFLHNGSVPNLMQLLNPELRADAFCVGDTEFDKVNVGFRTGDEAACKENGWTWLDTTVRGNYNEGHYKTDGVPANQREALLEFLKTL